MGKETMRLEMHLSVCLVACESTDGAALHADFKGKVCHFIQS